MQQLIDHISRIISIPEKYKQRIPPYFQVKLVKRGQPLLKHGEICVNDYFVLKGAMKHFFINPQTGEEEIISLAIKDWWVTDLDSFRNQIPATSSITVIKDSQVLALSNGQFERLCTDIPIMERYFRLMLERHVTSWTQRIYMRNALTAEERLEHFIKKSPQIYNSVPQYLVASYLGMSAEMLSKLRAKRRTL